MARHHAQPRQFSQPRIVIIGGGGTGAAISYELAHRGIPSLLLERGSLTSGTTGRHHGLLHSGARYLVTDLDAARECWEEAQVLRAITTDVIEDNGGVFVSPPPDTDYFAASPHTQAEFIQQFEANAAAIKLPIHRATSDQLHQLIPALNPAITDGFIVPDASFDAWRLPLQFFSSALQHHATIKQFCEVVAIHTTNHTVSGITYRDHQRHTTVEHPCDIVINATGVWTNDILALCGLSIPMNNQSGTMLSINHRLCNLVINRLAPPGDGDIIVPQRAQSIIGTTSHDCSDPTAIEPTQPEIDALRAYATEFIPSYATYKTYAVWSAVRPLFGAVTDDPRAISRKSIAIDHATRDATAGLFTITGGKATTLRAMAVECAALLTPYLPTLAPSQSHRLPLAHFRSFYKLFNAQQA